jgi:hypothetical protein
MLKYLFIIGFLVLSLVGFSQTTIDSIKIYKYFKIRGYTTVGAHRQFDRMDSAKVELSPINKEQVDTINSILIRSKKRMYFQQKYGIKNVFFVFYIKGQKHLVLYGFDCLIVDFTDKRKYWIGESSNVDYMKRLVKLYNTTNKEFNDDMK